MDIFKKIEPTHLTPDLLMLVDICGIENVRLLLRHFSGLTFYIPKISSLKEFVLEYLQSNIGYKSYKTIALELGVSETFLKKLERSKKK